MILYELVLYVAMVIILVIIVRVLIEIQDEITTLCDKYEKSNKESHY